MSKQSKNAAEVALKIARSLIIRQQEQIDIFKNGLERIIKWDILTENDANDIARQTLDLGQCCHKYQPVRGDMCIYCGKGYAAVQTRRATK